MKRFIIPKGNSSPQIISLFLIVESIGFILRFLISVINEAVSLIHSLDPFNNLTSKSLSSFLSFSVVSSFILLSDI